MSCSLIAANLLDLAALVQSYFTQDWDTVQ
jgi:hypothetical protein